MDFNKADLLAHIRSQRLALLSSIEGDGGPQFAHIDAAITATHDAIFETLCAIGASSHDDVRSPRRLAARAMP